MAPIVAHRRLRSRRQTALYLCAYKKTTIIILLVLLPAVCCVQPVAGFVIPSVRGSRNFRFRTTTKTYMPTKRSKFPAAAATQSTALNLIDFVDLFHEGGRDLVTIIASTTLSVSSFPSSVLISTDEAGAITSAASSWRQYVPLAVSSFVILDILLGSPFVNMIMKPMRDASMGGGPSGAVRNNMSARDREDMKKKERIDTDKVAQDAIDRAQNALELRNYLESRKSDWDRMEEMKKSIDQNMKKLDDDLEAKQRAFESRSKD